MVSLLGFALLAMVRAGEVPVSFLRCVNATAGGSGNLTLRMDGEVVFEKGYATGQVSGGIGTHAGKHRIELSKEGAVACGETLDLKPGTTCSLIVFTEHIEGGGSPWRLRLLKIHADPAPGYQLRGLSLCRLDELSMTAKMDGGKPAGSVTLKRHEVGTLQLGSQRGRMAVKIGEAKAAIDCDDPGNYMLVIYEDAAGKLQWLSYYDPVFEPAG